MADFITFEARGGSAEYTVQLKRPVPLFDETHGGYRAARARAARHIKRELGLHPCAKVVLDPRDWSDGVDALSEATLNARVFA
jgi:hypothetical protein